MGHALPRHTSLVTRTLFRFFTREDTIKKRFLEVCGDFRLSTGQKECYLKALCNTLLEMVDWLELIEVGRCLADEDKLMKEAVRTAKEKAQEACRE